MSKIICDVCGTTYPDSATQCPICGCVRSADVEAVIGGDEAAEVAAAGTYTYVKGGRFSKANVKKRNSGKPVATASAAAPAPTKKAAPAAKPASGSSGQKSNLGLIIVIILLLLAIVAVLSYIAIRFVVPNFLDMGDSSISEYVPTPDNTDPSTEPTDPDVPCTGLVLSDPEVYLNSVGDTYELSVVPEPEDTTDEIFYTSDDEEIATVDEFGLITAVAKGETIITVTCGTQTALCRVVCNIETEPAEGELVLDAQTYTLAKKGDTWTCYTGTIALEEITWASDDETIATVANGVVTAVGAGTTTIRATYNDVEVTCEIVCGDATDSTTDDTSDDTTEDTTNNEQSGTANANYKFNTHDANEMMLRVGESFGLRLCDENGKALSGVKYTSSNDSVCTVSEKGTVKCVAYGETVYISAEYNGAVYKCKVYVR